METAARVTDPAQREKLLAIILDDVNRLDRLISDISEASRVDSELSREETTSVDIGRMLETIGDIYTSTSRLGSGDLICEVNGDGASLMVNGHENRLVQVIRNLIDNAVTFSPPDGRITIRAGASGQHITISGDDEGIGIPEGKLDAIFDRFYSERPAGEKFGTHSGLGLSICRQIVAAHDGWISAENRKTPGGEVLGARFILVLPKAGLGKGGGTD